MSEPSTSRRFLLACLLVSISATARAGVPQFERPIAIEDSVTGDWSSATGPFAAITDAGTWVVAWESVGELLFARSTDHGLSFSPRAPLNTDWETDQGHWFDLVIEDRDTDVSVAAGTSGKLIAVWRRTQIIGDDLLEVSRSTDDGVSWSPPAVLYTGGGTPKIATDGAGTWIIVWTTGAWNAQGHNVFFTRSTDDATTWSAPKTLTTTAPPFDTPDSYVSKVSWAAGVWVVVWTNRSSGAVLDAEGNPDFSVDADVLVSRSIDGGATWSPGMPVNPMAASDETWDEDPNLTSDGAGNWILAWTSRANADTHTGDILAARSSDGAATWSVPVTINTDGGTTQNWGVQLAAGSPGTYVAAWTYFVPVAPDVYSGDTEVLTSSSLDGGLTWSPVQPLNLAATDEIGDGDYAPFVAHDPAGHWLAFWNSWDRRVTSGNKDSDIVMALGDHPCGNGSPDSGEQCDTGARGALDCCSRVCTLDPAGTECAADAELCTRERCDGAGTCEHLTEPAGTLCQPDTDLCTFDRCDSDANCEHVLEPRTNCKVALAAGASKLQMESDGSEIRWKWSKGEKTDLYDVGQAVELWNMALCIFDGEGLVTRVDAPLGERCTRTSDPACWESLGGRYSGVQYTDRDSGPNGITKLTMKLGPDRKVRASVQAGGPNVDFPGLPITGFPLTVQLVNSTNVAAPFPQCWEAIYSSRVSENSPTSFSATSE